MSFSTLGLSPELLRAVADEGYATPTPVQLAAIPLVLEGRDLLAGAQTGTGKTAAFVLPIIQRLHETRADGPGRHPVRVLVVVPTRELAIQVEQSVQTYGVHRSVRSATVYGGVGFGPQVSRLRAGPEIVVATPGRLLDHIGQGRSTSRGSRSSSSTRPTGCWTWASSATSARSSPCFRTTAEPAVQRHLLG